MQPAQTPHPHRRTKRYAPAALGATLLLALAACSGGGGTSASPSATATPSPSATSAKATPTPSPTRTVTVTEATPTPGTVQTATAEATATPGTITTASATASAQTGGQAQASSTARASSAPASLSSSEVKSAGGTCGTLEATGYLKHDATIQVASGAVDCLFAKELIRQFVVQNPAEVTDKANGEREVMSARCYWKPGDGVDRATPECVSLDGGGTVITAKLTN